jgi:cell division protein FtsW
MQFRENLPENPFKGLRPNMGGDKVIWSIVLLLALVSMLVVYSSTGLLAWKKNKGNTEWYLFKQVVFTVVGLGVIYVTHIADYKIYSRLARILLYLSVPLLIYTYFFGVKLNEGSRWLMLPFIHLTFQTSDLAKLALVMFLSRHLSKNQEQIKDFKKGYRPMLWAVVAVCICIAPANLSTALLVGGTSGLLMFIGRVSFKHLFFTSLAPLSVLLILVMLASAYWDGSQSQVKNMPEIFKKTRVSTWVSRVQSFMYESESKDQQENYQVNQSMIAIAKGGILGVGPGNSEQRNFLPHPYSDFIFAIIVEEYGVIGGAIILFFYLMFLFRSIRIFNKCEYAFGGFLALGLSFTLVIQALVNMAVAVHFFPVTGVTLPLVSMGGSSFIFNCISIGIILSVSRHVEQVSQQEPAPMPEENNQPIEETTTELPLQTA